MAEIQFLSLLLVLSLHGTVSAGTAGRPRLVHLQEQLDNLKGQFEQFRHDINTKLDQSVSARLERLEKKLEEISPTVTTTPTTGPVEARTNSTSADWNTMGGIPKLPAALWAQIAENIFVWSNDLHEQLRTSAGPNSIFSPIGTSFTMFNARSAAGGGTKTELDNILRVPPQFRQNEPAVHAGTVEFLGSIHDPVEDYNVTLARKMYVKQGVPISQKYDTISRQVLDSEVEPLDFLDGQRAVEVINSWVETKLDGKMRHFMSPASLNSQTTLLLVNANNFKSPWEHKFEADRTQKQVFHLNSTATTEVDMMFSSGQYSYAQLPELNAQLVVLPYKGGRFSMQVFIPTEIDGLEGLLQAMKNAQLNKILSKIGQTGPCDSLSLHLPKFKIESTFNLAEPLKQIGARAMFSATDANFTGISDVTGLYLTDVIQKAYIEVDEMGTEATVATVVKVEPTCEGQTREMTADRPFYFQVIEEDRNLIMFTGVVFNPSA